ncbi:MAG TPA: penicillin-binding protein activator LpoB [Candidatus Goldiibacteriota bacterium]|nr:penicillin-binding protein activator LpoB [Candidatus Goldiibacteriota bacterium]
MKKLAMVLAVLVIAMVAVSCAGTTVKRVETDTVMDLSGRWNDTDAQLVAEQMVKEMLERPWLRRFLKDTGKEPRVIVGDIRNKTEEHIEVETFRKDIEKELTNSGDVRFVASAAEREEIRKEREDMQEYSSESTMKQFKKETAADYMLKGVITSISDAAAGKKVIYYQIDLELFDTESNEKAWVGQKKIKKIIDKPGIGF